MGGFILTGVAAAFAYSNFLTKRKAYNDLPEGETKEKYDKKYNDYNNAANIAAFGDQWGGVGRV